MTRILAGDIGGTKTLLQIVRVEAGQLTREREQRFDSRAYPDFEKLVAEFLGEGVELAAACFAVAGPVVDGEARITNLPWVIQETSLQSRFGIAAVSLVNDFYAVARGVPLMRGDDLVTINEGTADPAQPIAILGAGTGLGEAFLFPQPNGSWRVVSSEGGHCDFAPTDDDQAGLLQYLRREHRHVSYERVVSGMGIANIYEYLLHRDAGEVDAKIEDIPAHVAAMAEKGEPVAKRAFEMFVSAYGAEAGNLALKVLARGGVYLAGGIAAKNVSKFTDGTFLKSFTSKGRFGELMMKMPVHLIRNAEVGLHGATAIAQELAAR